MAGGIVHITEKLHTGHVREASYELAYKGVQVADRCLDLLSQMAEHVGGNPSPIIIARLLSPDRLPVSLRRRWRRNEDSVEHLLQTARVMPLRSTPIDTLMAIEGTRMERAKETIEKVVGFWHTNRRTADFLTTEQARADLDTLTLALSTYVGSRYMRRALYRGTYAFDQLDFYLAV